ncbi:hypothetical protein DMP06_04220 [Slackia equolifaciens]|uniref:Molecular chaperone TorD n=1 Tax=Slackia equolifaciens TaxID=498718 RepID=A0A3N0B0D3_9ACTN|nr:molecular chaperone TorD family protein [Slackia equolifaciens]RNL40581.1 hypothetical protein DMP06_04220 [Slackia equolifaciens]
MRKTTEESLRLAIGMADSCELFGRAFSFPDRDLAYALTCGSFQADCASCLNEIGLKGSNVDEVALRLRRHAGGQPDELCESLRVAYSIMYLTPGGHTPIFPYESAFLHVAQGREDVPALFQTRVALDVERCMKEAGVMPKDAHSEPCDSVQNEFLFLSYLFGSLASALHSGDCGAAADLETKISSFASRHVAVWLPDFLIRTIEYPEAGAYAHIAQAATLLVGRLCNDYAGGRESDRV